MPNAKNRIKSTGDTHPPELDDVIVAELDTVLEDDRANAVQPQETQALQAQEFDTAGQSRWLDRLPYADRARSYAGQARDRVSDQPLAALGIALALGFVVGKLMRR